MDVKIVEAVDYTRYSVRHDGRLYEAWTYPDSDLRRYGIECTPVTPYSVPSEVLSAMHHAMRDHADNYSRKV